ncbi:hypothetical protein FA09DRAFT_207046 [Tilletiopsis washingtonensis]|uniref:Uncharacterized protein n=1 Tax=Tilletiopsis washingtonensis TaxID=58919 RepID=A0A316ZGJ1_9BASI|nr:hypothetical protein FA09DRAFT_207046 [Tilletiopsis washingtonensis]PWO00135.1 hypothetical protein FA09DRAFT_207046 [Tilletiopsis washingtonensis]
MRRSCLHTTPRAPSGQRTAARGRGLISAAALRTAARAAITIETPRPRHLAQTAVLECPRTSSAERKAQSLRPHVLQAGRGWSEHAPSVPLRCSWLSLDSSRPTAATAATARRSGAGTRWVP